MGCLAERSLGDEPYKKAMVNRLTERRKQVGQDIRNRTQFFLVEPSCHQNRSGSYH
jgi:hypothetical protein